MYYVDVCKHRKLRKKLATIDVLVIRRNVNGVLAFSKPCLSCIHILKRLNIRSVYYSDRDGIINREYVSQMESTHMCDMQTVLKNVH
jgi:hypothetical protein